MKFTGLIAAAFLITGTCQAVTALGDPLGVLGNLPGNTVYTGDAAPLSSTVWVAVGVTTGSTELEFTSLEGFFSNTTGTVATLNGGIYSDSSGSPGSLVGTFGSESLGATYNPSDAIFGADTLGAPPVATSETFTTTQTVDLQANTNYWFVIDDYGGVSWRSDSTNQNAGTAPSVENSSGFSFVGYAGTSDSGTSWTALTSDGNPTVQIDASPLSSSAPEPGSIFLISCGCVCLLASRRLRRAQ